MGKSNTQIGIEHDVYVCWSWVNEKKIQKAKVELATIARIQHDDDDEEKRMEPKR